MYVCACMPFMSFSALKCRRDIRLGVALEWNVSMIGSAGRHRIAPRQYCECQKRLPYARRSHNTNPTQPYTTAVGTVIKITLKYLIRGLGWSTF